MAHRCRIVAPCLAALSVAGLVAAWAPGVAAQGTGAGTGAGALERGWDGLGPPAPRSGVTVEGGYDSEDGLEFRFRYGDRHDRPRYYPPVVIYERERAPRPERAGKLPPEPVPVPAVAAPEPADPAGPALRTRAAPAAGLAPGDVVPAGAVLVMLRDPAAYGLDAPGPGEGWARLGAEVVLLRLAERRVVRVLGAEGDSGGDAAEE